MSALTERLDAALEAFGEPISIDATTVLAIVRTVSPAEARVYIDTTIVDAAGRPIRGFFVGPSTEVSVGSVITWMGDDFEVQEIRRHRLSGGDLGLTLIATLTS